MPSNTAGADRKGEVGYLRAGIIYGAANALSAGIPFLLLPVLTRALSPAEYGVVINFFLLISLCASVAGLNVHSAVSVKWFDRGSSDFGSTVTTGLLVAIASSVICGAVLALAAPFLQDRLELPVRYWFFAALTAGSTVIIGVRTLLWQSQGLALRSASLQVANAALNVGLSLVGVFALGLGGDGRVLGALAAGLISAAAAIWLLFRSRDATWHVSKTDRRMFLRFGLPLIPHALAGAVLATADRFSVSAILGREALGIYGTAAQVGMVMAVLSDALIRTGSRWLYAQMAARTARSHLRVVGVIYMLIPIWIGAALVLWCLFELVGPLLLDARYRPAVDLSIWFFLGGAVTAIYQSIAGLFFFTSRNEWLSLATMTAAASSVIIAPFLCARLGVNGAGMSYLLVQILLLILSWLLSTRVQPMPWKRPQLALRVLRKAWSSA